MGALISFTMFICMPLKPWESFLVDNTAIPEHSSRLDFTISTTNLHCSFHHHVLAPKESDVEPSYASVYALATQGQRRTSV